MTIFATRLKKLREEKNISQQELAEVVGTTNKAVSTWEQGTKVPRQPRIKKLADYFNVSVDYLLGRTEMKMWENWDEQYDTNTLGQQAHIFEVMQKIMPDVYELLMEYNDLNEEGKKQAVLRIKELTYIPEYKKESGE